MVRAVCAIAVLSFVSACAAIPTTGPVLRGRALESDPRDGVSVIPEGPRPGDSAEGIVTGFLRAAAGFGDDHQVARSFLTPPRRLVWRPDDSVVVYPGESSLATRETAPVRPAPQTTRDRTAPGQAAGEDAPRPTASPTPPPDRADLARVVVKTPVEARVDSDGRYTLAPPGDKKTVTFDLVRTGDDWRISALADGILVARSDFDVTFRAYPVYFTDPGGRYLVPDLHWFPGTRDQQGSRELPTALVRALLSGPPDWLQGAAISGFPEQTRMAVAAVVVSGDVATVDLTDQARLARTRGRQLLNAQLQATLGQLRTVSAVKITVRQRAFDIPTGSDDSSDPALPAARPVADPQVDSRPVVIDQKGKLARLDGGTLQPVAGVGQLAVAGANRPAVAVDSSSAYAVLDGARQRLLLQMPGAKAETLVKAAGLTAPSFDPQGWVWTSAGGGPGYVWAAGADTGAVKVAAAWARGYDVVALRISRDGTRAAVAVRMRGRAHLFVSGVVRDAGGRPQQLNAPIGLVPDLAAVRDVAWAGEDQLAVLGRRAGGAEQPWVVQIGGGVHGSSAAPGAESIAAGNGELSLMTGTANGILGRSGLRWQRVSTARWPAFPG
jgi:hypothetical protein